MVTPLLDGRDPYYFPTCSLLIPKLITEMWISSDMLFLNWSWTDQQASNFHWDSVFQLLVSAYLFGNSSLCLAIGEWCLWRERWLHLLRRNFSCVIVRQGFLPMNLTSMQSISCVCFSDDEDSECLNGEGKVHPSPGHNQSYLCIPFQKNEDWDGPSSDANDESTPVNSATSTPQLTPTNSLKRSGSHHKRCEVALLGCGAVLAAAGLGFDLLEAGKCQLLIEEEPEPPKEEKKKRDSIFQRAGRPRRSTSPPSRKIFKKDEPMLLLGEPSTSLTLLSLSSISECNSTRSLLRSDSDEIVVYEMPVSPVTVKAPLPAINNPLVNVQIERFKQDPNQSLTPTHVTVSSHTQQGGHRRTPSDGAIKGTGLVVNGCPTSGCPSSSCLTGALGAGRFSAIFLFLFRRRAQTV